MRDSLADQLRNWKGRTMSNTPPPKGPPPEPDSNTPPPKGPPVQQPPAGAE